MAGFRWGIFLSAFYLFSILACPIWAVDDSTIQAIKDDVSTTKGKTDEHDGKIKNLEGGLPAETAARIAADQALQNEINNIALLPGPQGPAGPPGPAYVPIPPTVSSLAGDYAMNGTRECVYTNNKLGAPTDFGPPPINSLPAADPTVNYPGGGTTRTGYYKGLLKLDGYGGGIWETKLVQINHNLVGPSQVPIIIMDMVCDASYQESVNGSIDMTMSNCIGPFQQVFRRAMLLREDPIFLPCLWWSLQRRDLANFEFRAGC